MIEILKGHPGPLWTKECKATRAEVGNQVGGSCNSPDGEMMVRSQIQKIVF